MSAGGHSHAGSTGGWLQDDERLQFATGSDRPVAAGSHAGSHVGSLTVSQIGGHSEQQEAAGDVIPPVAAASGSGGGVPAMPVTAGDLQSLQVPTSLPIDMISPVDGSPLSAPMPMAQMVPTALHPSPVHPAAEAMLAYKPEAAAGPSGSTHPEQLIRPAVELVEEMTQGVSLMHEVQTHVQSVATSSQLRSQQALRQVEELRKAREDDQIRHREEMDAMKKVMKEQLDIAKEAVSSMTSLRQELADSRTESRKLHEAMRERQTSHLSAGPSQPQPSVGQTSPPVVPPRAESMSDRLQRLEAQLSEMRPGGSGWPQPSAPPLPAESQWKFSQSLAPQPQAGDHSPFQVHIKPREPPLFTGDRGQDVITWLRTVDDYLSLVNTSERQAVAYIILLLTGNARCWWDAEFQSRGQRQPDTVSELKMLLTAQFESPVRESRARTELLNLQQRKGENACAYMARTKTLLYKVPGFDMKSALQQWLLGLRQPFRLEAAKAFPRTLAEAERLVARLEDAMEFAKAGKDDTQPGKMAKGNNGGQAQKKKGFQQNAGKGGNQGQGNQGNKNWQNQGNRQGVAAQQQKQQQNQQNRQQWFNRGQGQAGQPRPPQQTGTQFHPGNQSGGSGQRGRGRNQRRPKVAAMSAVMRNLADQLDREADQQTAVMEDASPQQGQGN